MTDYFVDPSAGSDGAAGTSVGTAWLTLQKAGDTAVGGDEVFYMNTATETPVATVDFDTNAGSAASPIVFTAADSDGNPLTTGQTVCSGSNLPAATDLVIFSVNNQYIRFKRIRFTGATRDNVTYGTNSHYIFFDTCRIDGAASDNIYSTTTGGHVWAFNTEIDNAVGRGLGVNAAGRLNSTLLWCNVHDNGGIGGEIGGDAESVLIDSCIFDSNGGDNIRLIAAGGRIINTTSYNSSGDNYSIEAANATLINNASGGATGYDYNINTTGDNMLMMTNNHAQASGTGNTNLAAMPGENNQSGDPLWADPANGDFQPSAASPLTDNGPTGGDIGAVKAASAGGGGASMMRNAAMTGGMR